MRKKSKKILKYQQAIASTSLVRERGTIARNVNALDPHKLGQL
jgi:hypothetical protein